MRRLRPIPVILSCFALLLSSACGRDESPRPRGLVLIVLDTVRADHLGYAGYRAARTPNIDALARRAWKLEDLNSPVPVTLPAMSSLLTGRIPEQHGVHDNAGFVLPDDERTLAEAFRDRGFRTAAILGSEVLAEDRGLGQGFEHYDDEFGATYTVHRRDLQAVAGELAGTRRRATEVTDRALAALDRFGENPFFLLVHYFDAHSYYDPPPRFVGEGPDADYDGEIAYMDHEIGRLLDAVDTDEVVVSLCADHGEGLGDHGESEHGFLLYQSTLHVPGLIAGPAIAPREDRRPASLVDLTATLAELFQLSMGVDLNGRSLVSTDSTEHPLYAENLRTRLSYDWTPLFSVRRGTLKTIVGGSRWEDYDLEADPTEHAPSAVPSAAQAQLRTQLDHWRQGFDMVSILRESEERRAHESRRAEALAALGYASVTPSPGSPALPHPLEALRQWERRQRDKARLRTAFMLLEERRLAEARALADSLEAQAPSADVHYLSCRVWAASGDAARSQAALDRALAADANHVPSLRELASRSVRAGRIEDAIAALEQIRRQLPDDPDTLYNLGVAHAKAGQDSRARRYLEHFIRVAPTDSRAADVRRLLASSTEKSN